MFSWGTKNTAEDLAETDTRPATSERKRPISPEVTAASPITTSVLPGTSATAAATGSDPAAAAAKSGFRDVVDALLLLALLHLVNLGFRWWNVRKLRKNKTTTSSTTGSITSASQTSSSSLIRKGSSKFSAASRFTSRFKLKNKKSARFQLSTNFSSDITSTSRASNLTSSKTSNVITWNEDDGSHSESTLNSQCYYPSRYRQGVSRSQKEEYRRTSMGRTWNIPQGYGSLPIVLNFATTTLEECLDQVELLETTVQNELELVDVLVKCCSQERVYFENYGAVASYLCQNSMKTTPRHSNVASGKVHQYQSPARLPRLNSNNKRSNQWRQALERKFVSCYRKDTKKLRKLRNLAMFFAHLLTTNSISYQVFDIVKLSEQHTTTASRYFLKILLKELVHHLTLPRLQRRIQEFPHAFAGVVLLMPNTTNSSSHHRRTLSSGSSTGSVGSRRVSMTSTTSTLTSYTTNSMLLNVKNMKFAVHYLTEIGLKPLTIDMRDHLTKLEKEQREQIPRKRKNALPNLHHYSGNVATEEEMPNISNHSVVTDASSGGSSINSTSIQSNNTDHGQSVVSQLSNSTRSRSTVFRNVAINTPHLNSSFSTLADTSVRSTHSNHSRESQGGKSASNTKKVSSHRKLSRRIVPHAPGLVSPQTLKRNLFRVGSPIQISSNPSTPASTIRARMSHKTSGQIRQLPNLPFARSSSFEKLTRKEEDVAAAESSTSSSDSETDKPAARSGAVGVVVQDHDDDDDNDYEEEELNDVDAADDSFDDDLKDDIDEDDYDDIYYGHHNLGKKKRKGGGMVALPEDTDGCSLESFKLPSDDEEAGDDHHPHYLHNDIHQDNEFQVTGRRNVSFRKRPSIIKEEI